MTNTKPFILIKDSYTFLQTSIFFEILAKTQLKNYPKILKENNPPFSIDFDTGNQYILRNDHICHAIEISNSKGRGFGLIAEIGLIQSFTDIISKFNELLDLKNAGDKDFYDLCSTKLGNQFNALYSIIKLFRNIFSHSITREYKLKKSDFDGWKKYHKKEGINFLKIDFTITNEPPHAIQLEINIDDIKEGISVFSLIGTGGMLMLIELIMGLCFEYDNSSKNPTLKE
ncbi:MAG: hypothetical protein PHH06_01215 [Candidatus Gracilibacteria bacterium]|nr:hypothetical protein [Candidatus Gracilibacteria bacterium]